MSFAHSQLLERIKMLTGVVEVGLFCGMAKAAYFGNEVSRRLHQVRRSADVAGRHGASSVRRWKCGKDQLGTRHPSHGARYASLAAASRDWNSGSIER